MRLVELLGVVDTDARLTAVLAELGDTKGLAGSKTWPPTIELKQLGIALRFSARPSGKAKLQQIQFELRRAWTGYKKYAGLLPYGLSSELRTVERATALGAFSRRTPRVGQDWCFYPFPKHEVAIGFGRTFVETVFVIAKKR